MAIKDGFKEDSAFSEVDRIMLELFLLTQNSGRVKGLLKKISLQLDVMRVAFVKFEGTRFQNHKYRATLSVRTLSAQIFVGPKYSSAQIFVTS